ncbi:SRPBCC family protein [Streptomyces sp. NPDC001407]|uniref:SRPBCC family protein n=1 Tax=unclassified Streptomyces TaxID=2593676 RepID=UPI0033E94C68
MPAFRIERRCRLSADEAWRRLTDWPGHAAHVPLTRIVVTTPPPNRAGTRFTARTGLGAVAFDDPMEVMSWTPPSGRRPGHCRLEKRGRVIIGWAEFDVSPTAAGALVVWREDLRIAGLPRVLDPLTAWAGRRVFGRVVRHLLGNT